MDLNIMFLKPSRKTDFIDKTFRECAQSVIFQRWFPGTKRYAAITSLCCRDQNIIRGTNRALMDRNVPPLAASARRMKRWDSIDETSSGSAQSACFTCWVTATWLCLQNWAVHLYSVWRQARAAATEGALCTHLYITYPPVQKYGLGVLYLFHQYVQYCVYFLHYDSKFIWEDMRERC